MTMSIDRAKAQTILPERVIGRVVGDQGEHIAIATAERPNGDKLLLAVRHDGEQYVIWHYGSQEKTGRILTFWGEYYDNVGREPIIDTFNDAVAAFRSKVVGA